MRPADVRAITRRSRDIEGWFSAPAAGLFGLLDQVQHRAGIAGDLFEIGVHHGRSAVLLGAMAGPEETLGVCDLFGDQAANVSASGSGDRARFERNVARVLPGFTRLRVFAKPSSELTSGEIGVPQRLFHVDGGHLHEEALGDLRLGASALHEQGAIVVDDPLRPEWPGVTEAILSFLAERSDFVPLVLGFNKLVLVPRTARQTYQASVDDPETLWSYVDKRVYDSKTLPLAGEPTRIILIPTWRQRPDVEPALARIISLRGELPYRAQTRIRSIVRPRRKSHR
jgi:Methyltransferase domain